MASWPVARWLLVAVSLALLLRTARALEAEWYPADTDGPLPLSREYHRRLGELCALLDKRRPLPAGLRTRITEANVRRQCAQLRQLQGSMNADDDGVGLPTAALATVAALGAAFLWLRGARVRPLAMEGPGVVRNPEELERLRAARLARLQQAMAGTLGESEAPPATASGDTAPVAAQQSASTAASDAIAS
jgi:hypothetical protein